MIRMFIDYDNLKISFIQKKPYCILKIDNFYTDYGYYKVLENFPTIEDIRKENLTEYNNKFYFNSDSDFYKKIITDNKVLKDFHNSIFNIKLLKFFYTKLFFHFISARKLDLFSLCRLFKLPAYEIKELSYFSKFFFNKIRPIVEFSYIFDGGKVVPHTDNKNKLLSLLTYFPDENKNFNNNLNLGTKFWKSKIKNYNNIHYKNDLETQFISESELVYNTPFDKKNLYGFIKNEYSWHSVEKINLNKNISRKSINISLLID